MSNAMVERVAIAICKTSDYACVCDRDGRTPEYSVPKCRECLKSARAAIEAMREPTEAMQVAGHNVRRDPETGLPTTCGTDEIYTAMIHAALNEPAEIT